MVLQRILHYYVDFILYVVMDNILALFEYYTGYYNGHYVDIIWVLYEMICGHYVGTIWNNMRVLLWISYGIICEDYVGIIWNIILILYGYYKGHYPGCYYA